MINNAIAVRKGLILLNTCAKCPGCRYSLSKREYEMFGFVLKVQELSCPIRPGISSHCSEISKFVKLKVKPARSDLQQNPNQTLAAPNLNQLYNPKDAANTYIIVIVRDLCVKRDRGLVRPWSVF